MPALALCACGTSAETESVETTMPAETTVETTEPEIESESEWLSDAAIDEAYACLFPLEGEKNVELAQEILLPLVEAGNAEAQYYWGYIYDWEIIDNNGSEERESLYWYELAAKKGFSKAYLATALNTYIESEAQVDELVELAKQSGLFEMTIDELGADGCEMIGSYFYKIHDYNSAFEWFTKAADMGCTLSMYALGEMYYTGKGVKRDISTSLDWLLKASNLGNVYAMSYYGYVLTQDEVGIERMNKKYTSMLNEYQNAAETGDPIAMTNLGIMYDTGYGNIAYDGKKAFEWFKKAAEAGDPYAMFQLGLKYENGYDVSQDYQNAIVWYTKAAEHGNPDAMYYLGNMYKNGTGVEKNNDLADEWFRKAGNSTRKQKSRYISYVPDTSDSLEEAIIWYQKAAESGHATAMNQMGYYLSFGRYKLFPGSTSYNVYPEKALEWFLKAADAGSATAMYNIGCMYNDSGYVEKDYDVAMRWYIKAYVNGYDRAASKIEEMLYSKQGINAYFENYGELISANP